MPGLILVLLHGGWKSSGVLREERGGGEGKGSGVQVEGQWVRTRDLQGRRRS